MTGPALSDDLARQAVEAVADYGDQCAASKALGLSRTTLQSRLRVAERRGIKVEADKAPRAAWEREKIALQDQVRDLTAQIKAIHREELTAENVREAIFGLVGKSPNPPRWTLEESKRAASVTGVPSVLWSDWHFGEVVAPSQVNGVNEYNVEIAQRRIRRLVERTIELCFKHMTNPNYPGIVVNLGGDMISGDIHEELTETNELSSIPAVLELFSVLTWALSQLINRFGRVFVACEYGNHGRNTKKPRAKNRAYTNFDWLLYNMLERHFQAAGTKEISFLIPSSTDAFYRVYGHRYLLTHGDALGVRGGDGIIGAIGPIIRGDVKIRSSSAHMGMAYDTLLMGHWHTLMALFPRLCVNGSLKGYDEFAKDFLRVPPEEPQQALWFTHPRRGITCSWPIKVDDRPAIEGAEWVSWQKAA